MAGIFFSYSSEDRTRVDPLVRALRDEGFEVWWDRDTPPGRTFREYITEQLDAAAAVVVVWSSSSVVSDWVLWEAQRARQRKVLVPIRLESAELPPEFFWIQAADLTRWQGSTIDAEWRKLVKALAGLAGTPSAKTAPPPQPPVTPPEAEATKTAPPPEPPVTPPEAEATKTAPPPEPPVTPPAEPPVAPPRKVPPRPHPTPRKSPPAKAGPAEKKDLDGGGDRGASGCQCSLCVAARGLTWDWST